MRARLRRMMETRAARIGGSAIVLIVSSVFIMPVCGFIFGGIVFGLFLHLEPGERYLIISAFLSFPIAFVAAFIFKLATHKDLFALVLFSLLYAAITMLAV